MPQAQVLLMSIAAYQSTTNCLCSLNVWQEAEEASQELDKLLNAAAKEGKLEKVYKVGCSGCIHASLKMHLDINDIPRRASVPHLRLQLIEDEFENASHRNVTTAFCKLAKLAGGADAAKQAEITSTRSFQMLVGMHIHTTDLNELLSKKNHRQAGCCTNAKARRCLKKDADHSCSHS
jgi:hypothetical protein